MTMTIMNDFILIIIMCRSSGAEASGSQCRPAEHTTTVSRRCVKSRQFSRRVKHKRPS